MEREWTYQQVMQLGIQLHVAGISSSNMISILFTLGTDRSRKAVYDWVQKDDLQPEGGESPNQVAVAER
jgi:putative transposase